MPFYNPIKKRKKQDSYLLALDIGTEFVKVAVLKIGEKNKQGLVIGVGRCQQDPANMNAGAVSDIDGVVLCCQEAIDQAAQMAGVRPQKAVIGIAGELVKGTTTSFVCKREDPRQPIYLPELKNLIQKTQWKAFDKIRRNLSEQTGWSEIEIKLINALVTDIRIDGHRITNPLGFQGKEVLINIFNVYAPLVHLGALQTIAAKLNVIPLNIAAEPYALARYSSRFSDKGAIFIDVGGGTTDIALVGQLGLEETRSLALAGRNFTKRLSQKLGLGLKEAEEIKIKYSQNELSNSVASKIQNVFQKDIEIWREGVELILEEFNSRQTRPLPCNVFLCGGGSYLPEVINTLKSNQKKWLANFSFNQLPKIDLIQPDSCCEIADQTKQMTGPKDIMPLALAKLGLISLAEVEKENALSFTVKRAVKIMQR